MRSKERLFYVRVLGAVASAMLLACCTHEGPTAPPAGPPAVLAIRTQPAGARVGSPFAVQPVVVVLDTLGRIVSNAAIQVTASLSSGGGSLLGTLTADAVNGVAEFADLRLTGDYGLRTLGFSAPGLVPAASAPIQLLPPVRSAIDRPDGVSGPQVHVMYVLPRGAPDRALDTDVDIAFSVAAFQSWLIQKTSLAFRFDLYQGVLDVTFFQLSRTDAEMRAFGAGVVTEIERQLAQAGQLQPTKRYLLYYDGGSTYACGGAAWPPLVPGQAAAMYLGACQAGGLVRTSGAFPGYWEFAALHDLIHTLGIVATAAPNHTAAYPGHVPEPQDLMYSGPTPWQIGYSTVVDVNHDDYFGPTLPVTLPNLATSPFLVTVTPALQAAVRLAPPAGPILLALPPHPPFAPR